MREFLRVARKLARENGKEFVDYRLRDNELIALFHDTPECGLAAAPGKHKGGYQDVGVEDDLQALR